MLTMAPKANFGPKKILMAKAFKIITLKIYSSSNQSRQFVQKTNVKLFAKMQQLTYCIPRVLSYKTFLLLELIFNEKTYENTNTSVR